MENQHVNETIQDRIRLRLDLLGLSAEAASRKAGMDKTYLRKIFERPTASPKGETLSALADALETTTEYLLGRTTASERAPEAVGDDEPPIRTDVRQAAVTVDPIFQMPQDVPVMGTAAGSHIGGAFQFEGGVVEFVRRPPAMLGVKNLYGLYIEGTSMEPEHRPGDLRFVHPDKPARIGDSVIVQIEKAKNGGTEATIGHLLKRTETSVFIGKLNPAATIEIKRAYVKSIHKVLTVNDLFGV